MVVVHREHIILLALGQGDGVAIRPCGGSIRGGIPIRHGAAMVSGGVVRGAPGALVTPATRL